jgi:hypothetical protein
MANVSLLEKRNPLPSDCSINVCQQIKQMQSQRNRVNLQICMHLPHTKVFKILAATNSRILKVYIELHSIGEAKHSRKLNY